MQNLIIQKLCNHFLYPARPVEKEVEIAPDIIRTFPTCPKCNGETLMALNRHYGIQCDYCPDCGGAIEWDRTIILDEDWELK